MGASPHKHLNFFLSKGGGESASVGAKNPLEIINFPDLGEAEPT